MPWKIKDILDDKVKRVMQRAQKSQDFVEVLFERHLSFDRKKFLISFDKLNDGSAVIEIKVYKDKNLLKEVMRYVMMQGGLQITHSKDELAVMSAV